MNNIGLNISTLRKEKGVTQEDLAKYVGISAQAVSKWENGGVPDIAYYSSIGTLNKQYEDLQAELRKMQEHGNSASAEI